jgi:hypothetical protein
LPQAVSDNVFDDVATEGIISCIKSKTLGEWETEDPKKRISFESASNGKSRKRFYKTPLRPKSFGSKFYSSNLGQNSTWSRYF